MFKLKETGLAGSYRLDTDNAHLDEIVPGSILINDQGGVRLLSAEDDITAVNASQILFAYDVYNNTGMASVYRNGGSMPRYITAVPITEKFEFSYDFDYLVLPGSKFTVAGGHIVPTMQDDMVLFKAIHGSGYNPLRPKEVLLTSVIKKHQTDLYNGAMALEYNLTEITEPTTVELSIKPSPEWFAEGQEVEIDWADGTNPTMASQTGVTNGLISEQGYVSHEYAEAGTYVITIAGNMEAYKREEYDDLDMEEALYHIRSFGNLGIKSFYYAFYDCYSIISVPKYLPASATNLSNMFNFCNDDPFNPDVSAWDTSNVTDMSYMFSECNGAAFNPDVSQWDVSSVNNMADMFSNCYGDIFNPDVSNWDVSNVESMYEMFAWCGGAAFNPDVSNWDVAKVKNMGSMFTDCLGDAFNPDVSAWDTSNVTDMSYMFYVCYGLAFNPDVSQWDVSNVQSMKYMFYRCYGSAFNPDVSSWNVGNALDMEYMFSDCYGDIFNPDFSGWDVGKVNNMGHMFNNCYGAAFNPNVSGWNVSSVNNMASMFSGCYGDIFKPNVSLWNVANVNKMGSMFYNCYGAAFNPDVSGWDVSKVDAMNVMFSNCYGPSFRGGRGEGELGIDNWALKTGDAAVMLALFMDNAKVQDATYMDNILVAWAGLHAQGALPINETIAFPTDQPYNGSISGDALTKLTDSVGNGGAGWTITSPMVNADA